VGLTSPKFACQLPLSGAANGIPDFQLQGGRGQICRLNLLFDDPKTANSAFLTQIDWFLIIFIAFLGDFT
jgi:hypothetical protein